MTCLGVVWGVFNLFSTLFSSWICGSVSDINWGKFSGIIVSYIHIFCFSFLSPSCVHITYMLHLLQYYIVFGYSEVFFFTLYFAFLLLRIFNMSFSSEILSSAVCSLISTSKAFFIFVTIFLISSISFYFFLGVSTSLLALPICSLCCLLCSWDPLAYSS